MRKAVVILGVLLVAVAVGGYVLLGADRKVAVRYRTALVERGFIISAVTATGTLNPVTTVQVGSQVSGMIEALYADFNAAVKSGQVVARIDPFPYRARRDQAAATLANAKAAVVKARVDLTQRKRELDRVMALKQQDFVSQSDVDTAQTAYEGAIAQLAVAHAAVMQAEAALRAAELDLKYTVIRSPIDGVVISRQVEVGQRVSATFQIPTLFLVAQDLTQMEVDTNVSESDIGGMTPGKEAVFTVDAYPGERFSGRVRQVRNAPINVQNVVTYNVVIDVENKDLRLKPGMTANVSIIVARRENVLKVPNAALRPHPPTMDRADRAGAVASVPTSGRTAMGKQVWRLDPSGQPVPVEIHAGISDGAWTEILSTDLHEGDGIITGIETPRSGQRSESLPPGFGSGQRRQAPRERGL